MKRILFSILALLGMAMGANAQNWNMLITHEDGSVDTISTAAVKNVSFSLPDQNVESVIIKELYNGGCPIDGSTSFFQFDKGFILYNNSSEVAVVNNLCVAEADPSNSQASNNWYSNGELTYASENYIPAIYAVWYFQEAVVLQPYSQIVISCMGSIDNTLTNANSVNYANKDYYAMYDPESGYSNTSYYPTPSDVIPTSHYLKVVITGQGNAWPLSVTSPAFFIFQTKGVSAHDYLSNSDNYVFQPGRSTSSNVFRSVKVPREWIIDGVEVFAANPGKGTNQKRLTSDIDNGYVTLTNKLGHTLYRNVDKSATEALAENSGKLVYNYSLAVDVSANGTDVIDAEASIKNGAHIIYLDDNNSSSDFHERQKFSIKGE